jgi:hypothetical protein
VKSIDAAYMMQKVGYVYIHAKGIILANRRGVKLRCRRDMRRGSVFCFWLLLDARDEFFKMIARILNIPFRGLGVDEWIRNNHHNVRIGRKGIDKGPEA